MWKKIGKDEIEDFALELENNKKNKYGRAYKIGAIKSYLKHVSFFFTWALEKGYCGNNPVHGLIKKIGKGTEEEKRRYLLRNKVELLRNY